jgi:foldase protein PrsA
MNKILFATLLIICLTVISGCGEMKLPSWLEFGKPGSEKEAKVAKAEGTALASVNGRIITLEDFNARIQTYNAEIQASKDIPETVKQNYLIQKREDKQRILDGMVERELLIAEAIKRGLHMDRELRQAVEALREQLLFAKLIEVERGKADVTTKEVEEYYNLYKDAFAIPEERRVSMIVLPTEAKAKEALISLLQGRDFSILAGTHSTDESAKQAGDIGFIVQTSPFPQPDKKTMFAKFEEVAFNLELNKSSAIFKGPDGFYIIKVTEIKPARERLLSEVYENIEQGLTLKKQDEALKLLIDNLRRSSDIIVYERLLR